MVGVLADNGRIGKKEKDASTRRRVMTATEFELKMAAGICQ